MEMIKGLLLASVVASTAGLAGCSLPDAEMENICSKDQITPAERDQLRKRSDFNDILDNALANCPELALQLVDPATGTILDGQDFNDGDGNGLPSGGGGGSGGGSGSVGDGGGSDGGSGGDGGGSGSGDGDDGPEDDGPEDDGPEDDGPEDDGPEDDGPADDDYEDDGPID